MASAAAAAVEEVEYESDDAEEAKRSLTMRRREASDDENEEREGPPRRIESRAAIESDGESDGRGAPAEYDDDEELELEDEELEEYEDEEEEEEEVEVVEGEGFDESGGKEGGDEVEVEVEVEVEAEAVAVAVAVVVEDGGGVVVEKQVDGKRGRSDGEVDQEEGEGEEKKESEPCAVPTAGAFYMHDDRFRDNAGGRNRRTLGGRKLWESKDDKKWGHDKFEEMRNDRPYKEGLRNSRGRYRAQGKNRGADRGYPRDNKTKEYDNNSTNNSQNHGPKIVRGRGPRRYEPSKMNNYEAPPAQRRRGSGKSIEKASHATSGRTPAPASNVESDTVPSRTQVIASSLSSASPPFYPSSSSNKEITLTQKRDVQSGTINRNIRSAVVDKNVSGSQSNSMMRGKNVVDINGMEKLYINDSTSPAAGKPSTSLQLPPGSSLVNSPQSLQPRAHGRGVALSGQMTFQPVAPHNLVSRASPPTPPHAIPRGPAQSRVQPPSKASVQQLGQRPRSGSQTSSPPKAALSMNSSERGESESPPGSSKSKTAVVGKGGVQVSAMSSFLYGGAQVIDASGIMGNGRGDQNFAATPAFFPVMPFGGQHPGGMGVPAVGMAFPGYVAQPQHGLGNSEMTWLPVLANAAGALGATYGSPYISVDGAYNSRQPGPTSSSGASSKESNINKPNNNWKPSQRPEVGSDEFGQRQKNTRRYTEMNFGQ